MRCWRERGSGWARTGPMEHVGQTQNDPRRLCEAGAQKGAKNDDRIGIWVKSSQRHWRPWT